MLDVKEWRSIENKFLLFRYIPLLRMSIRAPIYDNDGWRWRRDRHERYIREGYIILLIIQPRYLTLIWKNFPTKESSTLVLRVSINFIAMMCDGGRDQNKICFWTFKATAPWMDHQITNCLLNNRLMQLSIHYAAYRMKEHISYTWSISSFVLLLDEKEEVLDKSTYFVRTITFMRVWCR